MVLSDNLTTDLTVTNRIEILLMLCSERTRQPREKLGYELRKAIQVSPTRWKRMLNNSSQPDLRQLVILKGELAARSPELVQSLDDFIKVR